MHNRVALAESARLQQRARLARTNAPTVPGATWVSLGPTEGTEQMTEKTPQVISGRINDIAVDPRDPSVVYIASSGGGVWKTFDLMAPAGATWLPLSDTQPSLAAGALALDPDHPDTLYVGYGDFVHTVGNSVARTLGVRRNHRRRRHRRHGPRRGEWHHVLRQHADHPSVLPATKIGLRHRGRLVRPRFSTRRPRPRRAARRGRR